MKFLSSLLLSFCVVLVLVNQVSAQKEIITGYDVIHSMYDKYEGDWYKNLTFTQKTSFYGQSGNVERVQMWYEALMLPGKLAIRFDEIDSNNGILFRDGTQYGYANGEKIQEVERVHELLVLGFDIYHQEPDTSAKQLESRGFDLEKMYEDEWQGRPVYVVGVDSADSTVAQFWIDKERLYFVRNITIGRANTIQEVHFNKYERLGKGWIAPEVIFYANGFRGLLEEYSQIVIPVFLNEEIFDPEKFTTIEW